MKDQEWDNVSVDKKEVNINPCFKKDRDLLLLVLNVVIGQGRTEKKINCLAFQVVS